MAPSLVQAASASLKFILYLPLGERRWKTPAVLAETRTLSLSEVICGLCLSFPMLINGLQEITCRKRTSSLF